MRRPGRASAWDRAARQQGASVWLAGARRRRPRHRGAGGAHARAPDGRPLLVITRTRPWQGIPSLRARAPKFHYVRFRPGEAEQALADLGLTRDEVLR